MTDTVMIALITSLTSLVTLVITLLLKKDQEQLKKQIDGQQDILIKAVAGQNFAEGQLLATDKAEHKAADLVANPVYAAQGKGLAAVGGHVDNAVPVEIVGQSKPLEIKKE